MKPKPTSKDKRKARELLFFIHSLCRLENMTEDQQYHIEDNIAQALVDARCPANEIGNTDIAFKAAE